MTEENRVKTAVAKIDLNSKKYSMVKFDDGSWQALRYSDLWPGMEKSGGPDNLHIALAEFILNLTKMSDAQRDDIARLEKELVEERRKGNPKNVNDFRMGSQDQED